jgi:hypothetical protein
LVGNWAADFGAGWAQVAGRKGDKKYFKDVVLSFAARVLS